VAPLKLWLLDADVVIDLLSLDVFDKLITRCEVFLATIVIDEVKFFKKEGVKLQINFREKYVESGLVKELSATADEINTILSKLPSIFQDTLDPGELESLAVCFREGDLTFCSCDAAAIRALPFLDLSDRAVSVADLLKSSGLLKPGLKDRHSVEYFKDNLNIGRRDKIYQF
jgi:hypothetical protein